MIEGSVDATAAIGVAPSARMPGVDATAPPIPNMPDRTPVPNPSSPVSTIRHRSDTRAEASLRLVAASATLRGVYIPIVTPFAADGSVALDALEGLAHRFL